MKILILSDSHRNIENLVAAVERERPDHILHLGDYGNDCAVLGLQFKDTPIDVVCGNCDGMVDLPNELELMLAGKKVFMTHGHRYGVKRNLESLVNEGYAVYADVVLYGHTHIQDMQSYGDMLIINPGSVGFEGNYAVMNIDDGKITAELKRL